MSAQQKALMRTLLPKLEIPDGTIDLRALFPTAEAFALEIGFGGGEHLAAQARLHSDWGFVGCEPFANGVAKLLTQIDAQKLGNVRIHANDARPLIARLPERSLSTVYILHPDPWPKLRHHKRRFIQSESLDELARVMRAGAELRVATDHMDYARWTLSHIMHDARFRWTAEGPSDWRVRGADWPVTRYEQKALKDGRTCAYLGFVRTDA